MALIVRRVSKRLRTATPAASMIRADNDVEIAGSCQAACVFVVKG